MILVWLLILVELDVEEGLDARVQVERLSALARADRVCVGMVEVLDLVEIRLVELADQLAGEPVGSHDLPTGAGNRLTAGQGELPGIRPTARSRVDRPGAGGYRDAADIFKPTMWFRCPTAAGRTWTI
jgi:hypothetical protein